MRKVVLVGSLLGRMGTSAMMGALNLCGADVGGKSSGFHGKNFKNPKGHFEILSIHTKFLTKKLKCYGSKDVNPPTLIQFKNLGVRWKHQFNRLVSEEFDTSNYIAMKAIRYYTFSLFYELGNYDIKVIRMRRNPKEQAASIFRVWKKRHTNTSRNIKDILKIIDSWSKFENELYDKYSICYLNVDFSNFISQPIVTMKSVCAFTGLELPSDTKIKKWIDPKLVNRKKL